MCTNPLIIVYDKGGTVEVYGECFKLIGLFCLLLLHVFIIFLNLQPPNVKKNTRRGLASHGTIFLVIIITKWLESRQPALKKNRLENRQPVRIGYN